MSRSSDAISDEHVFAIGRLVVGVTRLEGVLLDYIAGYLQAPHFLLILSAFSHQQAASNLDTVRSFYTIGMSDTEIKDDPFLKLLADVRSVIDFRNMVVHAIWVIDDDGKTLAVRYQSRGKFKRVRRSIKSSEIHAKADEAAKYERLLLDLRRHLFPDDHADFERPPPRTAPSHS